MNKVSARARSVAHKNHQHPVTGTPGVGKVATGAKGEAQTTVGTTPIGLPPSGDVKRQRVFRRVSSLRPHPLQAQLFSNLPEAELRLLADNLQENGQIDDIEIVGDNLVICGWQRTRAMKLLKWKEARCWVRDDLMALGDDAVERRLIEDNFHRRQLDPLDKARCYRRLKQLDQRGRNTNGKARGDLRDYLGQQFHCSGRTLDRWERVLDTPIEIQQAVSAKKLTMGTGEKVAGLSKAIQEQIAAAIRQGTRPQHAVAAHIRKETRLPAPDTAYRRLYRGLGQALESLKNEVQDIEMSYRDSHLPRWVKSNKLIKEIIAKIRADSEKRGCQ
jgi:ParB-like chromosome segregation protein Spo0J